ncbi:carboxylesterase/lipase family protein [Frankia sp. AgKG'84/4]|uniref:carboxylesterase/lipase family protein n=1 Tax=Frankia sp. AgKG'84/4 TaxID=573490 RepID=UPI00200DD1CD|nr:carboxylesterase family protein [Frankia sp. AgKG'84/4]MCL9793600.1 carboxylesterase family protein [Frankia sp. AgKG'84/4]
MPLVAAAALAAGLLTACTGSSTPQAAGSTPPTPPTASRTSPAASPSSGPAPLTVDTTSGRLHGLATSQAREFLGVRYAEAPTGDQRWTMPTAPPKPVGTVEATKAGPSCAQGGSAPGASATTSTSEDCLFLNVTTPTTARTGEKLPVMVWWHGSGYTSGSGSSYDAARLADQGHVIVVTLNYRLGVFGYLSLPGLAGSGDFGLADQILATRWAKRNAAAFGGDPDNITVFGESAGAMSACALLTSPVAKGLVNKVAMSSGGACQLNWPRGGLLPDVPAQTPYVALADSEKLGVTEAGTLGCTGASTLSCLRDASTADLLKVFPVFSDVLAYDTPLLPENPATAVTDGRTLPIPVLSTSNHDEQRAFVGGAQKVKPYYSAASYPTYLAQAFGPDADKVAAQYPLTKYPNPAIAWSTVITDASWSCPTLAGNAALATHGSTVYGGEFDDPHAPDISGVTSASFDPGAAHAADLPYLFDLLGQNYLRGTAQTKLSAAMIDYWTSFARTGTPTAEGQPAWPKLSGTGGPTLQLNPTEIRTVDLAAEHNCAFWTTIPS